MGNNNCRQNYYYTSIEEVRIRKTEIQKLINEKNKDIQILWNKLSEPPSSDNRNEYLEKIISNGIAAYDGFMLARKLTGIFRNLLKEH